MLVQSITITCVFIDLNLLLGVNNISFFLCFIRKCAELSLCLSWSKHLKYLFEYASVGICDYTLLCFQSLYVSCAYQLCLMCFPAFLVLHIYLYSLGFIYRIYLFLDLNSIKGVHATQFIFCWIGNYLHQLKFKNLCDLAYRLKSPNCKEHQYD